MIALLAELLYHLSAIYIAGTFCFAVCLWASEPDEEPWDDC